MIGKVEERRAARTQEIVDAAWELAREVGVASVSLRSLADAVGMRQPSLYEYFASKNDLYDAMFADGNRKIGAHLATVKHSADARKALKQVARAFIDATLSDSALVALLFERPIPGFSPSAASYAEAEAVMGQVVGALHAAGVTEPADIDCFVAMVGGLIAAQSSNDPGGKRWTRHLDRLIDLYTDDALRRTR